MHRTNGDSYGLDGSKRVFQPEVAGVNDATQLDYTWANAVQEEICNVIEGFGGTLRGPTEAVTSMNQMYFQLNQEFSSEEASRKLYDQIESGAYIRIELIDCMRKLAASTIEAAMIAAARRDTYNFNFGRHADGVTVGIGAGCTVDSEKAEFIRLEEDIAKSIDGEWVEGDGAGRGGALTDATWYHVFVIRDDSYPYTVDAGFDTDDSASNLRTRFQSEGYTNPVYRRIGSVYYVDGTEGIRDFQLVDPNTVLWQEDISGWTKDDGTVAQRPSVTTVSLPVPSADVSTEPLVSVMGHNASAAWRTAIWDRALSSTFKPAISVIGGGSGDYDTGSLILHNNNGNQMYMSEDLNNAGTSYWWWCRGYKDLDRLSL